MDVTKYGLPADWPRRFLNIYDCFRSDEIPIPKKFEIIKALQADDLAHYLKQRASGKYQYHLYYVDLPFPFFAEVGYLHGTEIIDHFQYFWCKEALRKYGDRLVIKYIMKELPGMKKGFPGEASK